jgi:hypothetical protein
VQEKTTDFTILFLFSIGITKGKWGTLVNTLLSFRDEPVLKTPLPRQPAESVSGTYLRRSLADFNEDFNLEKPGASLFRTDSTIHRKRDILDVIQDTPCDTLKAMAAGRHENAPSYLFDTHRVGEVFSELKFYYDTIIHNADCLEFAVKTLGVDHVVYGTDYPADMGYNQPAQEIPGLSRLSKTDQEKILFRNAMKLYGV